MARDAFQRLIARWGCLHKLPDVKLQDLPVVIGACCVLHNICERANEAVDPGLGFKLLDDDNDMVAENPVRSMAASSARDAIAHNLLLQSQQPQSRSPKLVNPAGAVTSNSSGTRTDQNSTNN